MLNWLTTIKQQLDQQQLPTTQDTIGLCGVIQNQIVYNFSDFITLDLARHVKADHTLRQTKIANWLLETVGNDAFLVTVDNRLLRHLAPARRYEVVVLDARDDAIQHGNLANQQQAAQIVPLALLFLNAQLEAFFLLPCECSLDQADLAAELPVIKTTAAQITALAQELKLVYRGRYCFSRCQHFVNVTAFDTDKHSLFSFNSDDIDTKKLTVTTVSIFPTTTTGTFQAACVRQQQRNTYLLRDYICRQTRFKLTADQLVAPVWPHGLPLFWRQLCLEYLMQHNYDGYTPDTKLKILADNQIACQFDLKTPPDSDLLASSITTSTRLPIASKPVKAAPLAAAHGVNKILAALGAKQASGLVTANQLNLLTGNSQQVDFKAWQITDTKKKGD